VTLERCAAWLAVLFLASVLFSHTVALRLLLLALGFIVAVVFAVRQRGSIQLLPQLWLPFALWAGWAVLSLAWSLDPERTDKELRNEVGYVAVAFWVCFVAGQARGAARIMLPAFAAAAAAVCSVALYLYFGRGWEPYLYGWQGGPGNFSSTVVVLMPCALMAAWHARQVASSAAARYLPLALAALVLVAAYTAESRTVWLALAAQLLAGAFLLALRANNGSRRRVLAGGIFAIAVATASVAMTAHVQLKREAGGARAVMQDPRLALWVEVAGSIGERPWLGYGFGRGMLRTSLREELKEAQLWHAHNLFLDAALQVGLPGVLLLLALLAATVREGWRMTREPSPASVACGVALITVVVGMLARNMTDTLLVRQNALLYWGVMGVLLAWGAKSRAMAR
jgi:O-antigen ligase